MEFKLVEQTRRLVEVTALLALSLHDHRNAKVIEALEKYAFPEEIAKKINSDPTYKKRVKRDYFNMTEDDYDEL
jgi:hypothetical protein